ncbi:MAG: hypothetical protein H6740_14195 [Alphaproteobacteria bacterium]|nr:hypothetical protein [Alphaproteobacteria bacterium]
MLILLAALGCVTEPEPVAWCEGPAQYDYRPDPDSSFTTFPDDHWTEPDASTPTGLRVSMRVEETPALLEFPDNYNHWFDELSTLDGFGVSAEIYFQFDGAIAAPAEDDVLLLALPAGAAPQRVDAELRLVDRDRTLMIRPRFPLPPATQVVAILLTDPEASDCVSPSAHLRALLSPETELGPDEAAPPLSERFRAGLEAAGLAPEQVAAMTVFTTQSATAASVAVALDIQDRGAALSRPFVCEDLGTMRSCTGAARINDYRGADGVVTTLEPSPQGEYELPIQLWLPLTEGPHPVVMCGHGLGGSTRDCEGVLPRLIEEDVAVVAVDAVEHGQHPSQTDPPLEILDPLMIFALELTPVATVDGLRLRDNFRQSAWDKLQVLEVLRGGMDVDGDGLSEIDPERIAYAGVSLGAIMGAEPLALSDQLVGGWIANGGARVTQIIQDSESFSVMIDLMAAGIDEGDIERGMAILQTLVDAGDPVAFAGHVTRDRLLDDGWEPSLVGAFSLNDEVVPNSTHENYMRALGVPGVGREVWEVEGVDFTEGSATANLPQGGAAGVVLFDVIVRNGQAQAASHGNLHESEEGMATMEALLRPLFYGGPPVVLDPYEE